MDKKAAKKGGEERKPRSVSKGDAAVVEEKKKRTSTSKGPTAPVEKKKGGKASATKSKSKGRQSSSSPAGKKGKASAGKGGKASASKAKDGKAGKGAAKGTPSRSKSKGKGKEAAKEETKSGKKAKKAEKEEDVGKPTRALSAYIYFSNETVPKLKQEEGIAHKDAMGKAGQIWNTLTDDKKKKFDELHEADVKRYEKQLKEWKEKGYYLLEGGIKSTDLADPKKKKEKSESKPSGNKKRSSSAGLAGKGKAAAEKTADKKAGKAAAAKNKVSKKSEDDLDIEQSESGDHHSEELEASD